MCVRYACGVGVWEQCRVMCDTISQMKPEGCVCVRERYACGVGVWERCRVMWDTISQLQQEVVCACV